MTKFRLLLSFITCNILIATGQKSNAEGLLGCWKFREMVFDKVETIPENFSEQTADTKVCFFKDNTFETTIRKSSKKVIGKYSLSEDGKKLSQESMDAPENLELEAEIVTLNEKELVFKLELGVMYFVRE